MKNTFISVTAITFGFLIGTTADAQLVTPSTTLSAAVPASNGNSGSPGQWCVASATSIVLPSVSTAGSYLVSGKEAAVVTTQGSSATCFNVKRAQLGSSAVGHASGDNVWIGNVATGTGDTSRPFSGGVITRNVPAGTCVASQQYSLPVIIVTDSNSALSGAAARCISGVWTTGDGQVSSAQPFTAFSTLSVPNAIAASTVTDVAGQIWFSQMAVPFNATLTGACVLNGSTVGTDKWIFALYDAAGNLLANTATAGVTTATASKYQCIAFTSTVAVTGPGTYFIALQGNGTTDTFQAYATAGAPTNYGTGHTSGTFGTIPSTIGVGTTFIAANGPIMMTY